MRKTFLVAATYVAMSGCTHFSVANFEKAEASGVSGSSVALLIMNEGLASSYDIDPIASYVNRNQVLQATINENCRSQKSVMAIAPLAIPIISSLGKLVFDMFIDAQVRSAEELKKAAQASYSEKVVLSSDELRAARCALVVRYEEENKSVGLAALLKFDNKNGRAFVVRPLFISANNAVAITKKQTMPVINLSIGVSAKGIGKHDSSVPGLFSSGEGVFSVRNIAIGASEPYKCESDLKCPKSDLIPYPEGNPVSITFSVTETGKIGIDFDRDVAELKAIKEAIGPALKESLKEYYK